MFIEITNKGSPLLLSVSDIIGIGYENKKGTFVLTECLETIYVDESYDEIKKRLQSLCTLVSA